ncbi:MAG: Flp pilus assembly complex ATPase component TadA [Pseudomonadales bacterium]|nr:Flp pilus assembly complex ATPase component TadA [Pseudomonadales bacterium]
MTEPKRKLRLGDLLVQAGAITEEQLMTALTEQKKSGMRLGRALISMGYVDEDKLLNILSQQLKLPYIDLKNFNFDEDLVRRLPETLARRFRAVILKKQGGGLLVGMSDPMDIFAYDEISRVLGVSVEQAVVRESELLEALDMVYRRIGEISSLAEELQDELGEDQFDLGQLAATGDDNEAPVVKLLQSIFEDAMQVKASDIHIEPDETVVRVRQRIDGVLQEHVMKERRITAALVLRLKLMSGLDISEKRVPQDGRFSIRVKGHDVDVRLSTMPTQHGESVVMRLLDHSEGAINLEHSGMPKDILARFRKLIHRPHGLILVTGPTGSGKTTTLYGALTELNKPQKKIITVEDPVEYQLERIQQVQVNTKIGLTFGKVLRATLRQDPDILLVGEIRDSETAEIALRASMTGHLVLSTLHTNDAVTSAMRLIDMGVEGYLAAASLRAVIAQRLVRRVCDICSADYEPDVQERVLLESVMDSRDLERVQFKMGKGCQHCNHTGYRGRIGVFEILEINAPMADALRNNDTSAFTKAAIASSGFKPLIYAALEYAEQGIISVEEVFRVAEEVDEAPENIEAGIVEPSL